MEKQNIRKLSVVMCTYNGEKYLRQQLDTIVNQTYPIYELLIQDDGSTDDTVAIIQEYAQRYPYIRLIINEARLGYNRNFQSVMYKASGDYIAVSDQDDVWIHSKLETLMQTIGDNDLCFSISSLLYPDGRVERERKEINLSLERLVFANAVSGHTALFRKDLLDKIPYWSDKIFFDWWLGINAATLGRICMCKQELTLHRVHSDSATFVMLRQKKKSILDGYLYGFIYFFMPRYRKPVNAFYRLLESYFKDRLNENTKLAYRFCKELAVSSPFKALRLCFICFRYRDKIYPDKQTSRVMSCIRGFCFPFLFYHTTRENKVRFC